LRKQYERPWPESFSAGSDLPERMMSLCTQIAAWQTSQEVIIPTCLPPFLRDLDG
jgi:hypothetical protein